MKHYCLICEEDIEFNFARHCTSNKHLLRKEGINKYRSANNHLILIDTPISTDQKYCDICDKWMHEKSYTRHLRSDTHKRNKYG